MYQISTKCTKCSLNLPIILLNNRFSLKMNFEFFLKSFRFPICHIFTAKKNGDKSGFGEKSEDALYILFITIKIRKKANFKNLPFVILNSRKVF